MSLVDLNTDFRNTWFITRPQRRLRNYNLKIQLESFLAICDSSGWNQNAQDSFTNILNNHAITNGADYLIDGNSGGARTRKTQIGPTLGLMYKDQSGIWTPTLAGKAILDNKNPKDALIRILLRYQYPNPYTLRKNGGRINPAFKVKPFVLLMMLIDDNELNGLKNDEFVIPVMFGHNYGCFNLIKEKILIMRTRKGHFIDQVENLDDVLHNPKANGRQYSEANIRDIANTFKNYLQGASLIVSENISVSSRDQNSIDQRWKINDENRDLLNQIFLEKDDFLSTDFSDEQFYRRFGRDDRLRDNRRETRINRDHHAVLNSIMRRMVMRTLCDNLELEEEEIIAGLVNDGFHENSVRDVVQEIYPRRLEHFREEFLLQANSGTELHTQFEKSVAELYRIKNINSHHIGNHRFTSTQSGRFTDVLVIKNDDDGQTILHDTKCSRNYSFPRPDKRQMVEYLNQYSKAINEYLNTNNKRTLKAFNIISPSFSTGFEIASIEFSKENDVNFNGMRADKFYDMVSELDHRNKDNFSLVSSRLNNRGIIQ